MTESMNTQTDKYQDIRDAVRALCTEFPDEYHRKVDEKRAYPEAFVDALTKAGWLAALIPQEYGGSGLGLAEASVIMEEINRSGGNSGACHGQMYNMGTLLRHGSQAQKRRWLPGIASGQLRLQSMAVTEPGTGTDTTKIKTVAVKKDGRWFVERIARYAKERVVFGRPIGQNQGVQFPIAEAHIEVEAADLMRWKACDLYDAQQPCGAEANMAKYLAAKASWEAANACLQFHGGFGFADEYDVERKFRETRLYQVAPISTNLILSYIGEHVLGMPRSF
jgi:alkylation response protein AidB-like acyl-CoA dehydrogenase